MEGGRGRVREGGEPEEEWSGPGKGIDSGSGKGIDPGCSLADPRDGNRKLLRRFHALQVRRPRAQRVRPELKTHKPRPSSKLYGDDGCVRLIWKRHGTPPVAPSSAVRCTALLVSVTPLRTARRTQVRLQYGQYRGRALTGLIWRLGANRRYSCSLFAPVVLALFGAADHYRLKHPSSRAPLLFLAVAGGIINSVSAEKAKAATNMMTGHYQKLSSDLADLMAEGATPQQKASAAHSVKICLTFWAAVTVGMASYNVKHGFKVALRCTSSRARAKPSNRTDVRDVLSQRKFSIVGGLYALLLLLHDAPAGQRKKLL
eukprot:947716-Rhodomonas_salina.1